MSTVQKEMDPVLESANKNSANVAVYTYDGGNSKFQSLVTEARFDYKKLGAQMFTNGFDLDKALAKLNDDWEAARASLGYK